MNTIRALSDLYGKQYAKIQASKTFRKTKLPVAARILYDEFKPKSVIDFGAANGVYLKEFKKRGCKVFGLEANVQCLPFLSETIGPNNTMYYDLRIENKKIGDFDLAISIEVLEHIERTKADVAVNNICVNSNTLFITASDRAGGTGHVNVQQKEYWVEKFRHYRFVLDKERSRNLADKLSVLGIAYLKKGMVFIR